MEVKHSTFKEDYPNLTREQRRAIKKFKQSNPGKKLDEPLIKSIIDGTI